MCISKNDLQIFCNKELLVEEVQHFIKEITETNDTMNRWIMPFKKTLRSEKCLAKCLITEYFSYISIKHYPEIYAK
jgi:hypothetical protein